MKESKSYYLDEEINAAIKKAAKDDNRSASDYVNLHFIKFFTKKKSK